MGPCVYSQSQLRVVWLCGLHLPTRTVGSSHPYYVGTLVCLVLLFLSSKAYLSPYYVPGG